MESYLFADVEAAADTMVVEGYHKPGSLTRSSGAWIHAAGTAMFEAGRRPLSRMTSGFGSRWRQAKRRWFGRGMS